MPWHRDGHETKEPWRVPAAQDSEGVSTLCDGCADNGQQAAQSSKDVSHWVTRLGSPSWCPGDRMTPWHHDGHGTKGPGRRPAAKTSKNVSNFAGQLSSQRATCCPDFKACLAICLKAGQPQMVLLGGTLGRPESQSVEGSKNQLVAIRRPKRIYMEGRDDTCGLPTAQAVPARP